MIKTIKTQFTSVIKPAFIFLFIQQTAKIVILANFLNAFGSGWAETLHT